MFNKVILLIALSLFTTNLILGSDTILIKPFNHVSVTSSNTGNHIVWEGTNNVAVVFYILQRSEDGVHYQPVAMISKRLDKHNYSFVDQKAKNVLTYYRVLNVDANGDGYFSEITRVNTANIASK